MVEGGPVQTFGLPDLAFVFYGCVLGWIFPHPCPAPSTVGIISLSAWPSTAFSAKFDVPI